MDMKMTVYQKDANGKIQFRCFDFSEFDMIVPVESRKLAFYVGDEVYYNIVSLDEIDEALEDSAYEFMLLDRCNLVNMSKVKSIDEEFGKVYFEQAPTKGSKYAHIAKITLHALRDKIRRIIARNTNTTLEYEMKGMKSRKASKQTGHNIG